ncbi:MAG: MliC family protein [Spirochaetia bacterium]|jgi:membrane-bound inhibitor of C-type lysozyme|nr:MliC family protein [Spirochaetia bacterium]
MKKIAVLIVLIFTLLIVGCVHMVNDTLKVKGGEPVLYQCENGDLITARYYSISDDSLYFVKVSMPDSNEYTLPLSVSASGTRYTDNHDFVWWVKGDTALVETRSEAGTWEIKYRDCKQISRTE